jgi:D-beta-D-heptose 7-phosphate kinase/D-beta-D-heptose 1-phosphate adenosyltransferase
MYADEEKDSVILLIWSRAMGLVFTNGCFDLLHVGHIRLLAFARGLGDRLVVGLNDDASVRRLKGPRRPIIPDVERQEVLMALRFVDEVILFSDDTPCRLLATLRPAILVKGPDALRSDPVGADLVRSWGGRVVVPNWTIGHSTTNLIERITSERWAGEY